MRYVFDLDGTIWNTKSKAGELQFAKHLIGPLFRQSENSINCPEGNVCTLDEGVGDMLHRLREKGHTINFLSMGGLWSTLHEEQPSVKILRNFGLYSYFSPGNVLEYFLDRPKLDSPRRSKNPYLEDFAPCIFIDDNQAVLSEARMVPGVTVIDRKDINSWTLWNG